MNPNEVEKRVLSFEARIRILEDTVNELKSDKVQKITEDIKKPKQVKKSEGDK